MSTSTILEIDAPINTDALHDDVFKMLTTLRPEWKAEEVEITVSTTCKLIEGATCMKIFHFVPGSLLCL